MTSHPRHLSRFSSPQSPSPRDPPSFPTRRSSDLPQSGVNAAEAFAQSSDLTSMLGSQPPSILPGFAGFQTSPEVRIHGPDLRSSLVRGNNYLPLRVLLHVQRLGVMYNVT